MQQNVSMQLCYVPPPTTYPFLCSYSQSSTVPLSPQADRFKAGMLEWITIMLTFSPEGV